MNVSFIKQMKNLEREVLLKSVELDDDGDDFQFELNEFSSEEEIIAVAPKCVRCNTCVGECPVNAIVPANIFRLAKITDKCVKCEICVQTCPVSAIKLIDNTVVYKNEDEEDCIEYSLSNVSCSHRVVRMNDISIDYSVDNNWDDCANLCPTSAFTLEFKEFFDDLNMDLDFEEKDKELMYEIVYSSQTTFYAKYLAALLRGYTNISTYKYEDLYYLYTSNVESYTGYDIEVNELIEDSKGEFVKVR